jgi:hypothetical protein
LDFIELPSSARGIYVGMHGKSIRIDDTYSVASSLAVTRVLINEVFKWFGMPTSILSDSGSQFHSAVFHEVCQMLGTSERHSTPHTPHSHGDVECHNRLVSNILRALQQRFPDIMTAWEDYVGVIQFFMDSYIVESHGITPTFFWHGHQPRIPASISLPDSALEPTSIEFVASFQSRCQRAWDVGRECQVRMAEVLDACRDSSYTYSAGGWAWLASSETPVPGDTHFQSNWQGPFKVVEVSTSTVTLDLPEHWMLRSNTFHVDKVKPFVLRDGDPPPPNRPRAFRHRAPHDRGHLSRITKFESPSHGSSRDGWSQNTTSVLCSLARVA